jgi:hypothetical protein
MDSPLVLQVGIAIIMSDSGRDTMISTCLPLIPFFVEADRHRIIV